MRRQMAMMCVAFFTVQLFAATSLEVKRFCVDFESAYNAQDVNSLTGMIASAQERLRIVESCTKRHRDIHLAIKRIAFEDRIAVEAIMSAGNTGGEQPIDVILELKEDKGRLYLVASRSPSVERNTSQLDEAVKVAEKFERDIAEARTNEIVVALGGHSLNSNPEAFHEFLIQRNLPWIEECVGQGDKLSQKWLFGTKGRYRAGITLQKESISITYWLRVENGEIKANPDWQPSVQNLPKIQVK